MSLAVRVIPCLDVAAGRVVKGLKFENLRDAGDPVEAARRYEAEGADELCFLDVAASHEERGTLVGLVARVADVLSIPFTVGGGVRSVEDAGALLVAGADRVTVNTAAVADPRLVTRLAERFGSQCVVVAVDAKRLGERFVVSTHGGRRITEIELATWVAEVTARGAGEILLTSMDADGTLAGFDLAMLKVAREVTSVPIVASGGAGSLAHFARRCWKGARTRSWRRPSSTTGPSPSGRSSGPSRRPACRFARPSRRAWRGSPSTQGVSFPSSSETSGRETS
ncbi:MAG: imidazole glycerol phosphate synthase subunit HisF [Holophagales bacterium]|nr:imidazole glycerol phosphate synthase subunit HisF [Holophagales bacterium]